jgi:hypothetical protein
MIKSFLSIILFSIIISNTTAHQKAIKPSGTWIEYRREASATGFCFDADGKRLPYNLIIEFKPKNIVIIKKDEKDPGTSITFAQQDSVLQISPTEKIIISGDDYCRYIGYKTVGSDEYTCYFINKSAYKKLSEAKRSTLSIPSEADMKYKSKLKKEKTKKED